MGRSFPPISSLAEKDPSERWGSFRSLDAIYKEVGMRHRRFEMALNTWANCMVHINRNRTKLFFLGSSPFHFLGEDWGMDTSRIAIMKLSQFFMRDNGEVQRIVE
ncbi:unnamed protein product [Fraxinus pennsylvanica]|uniref:Trichome birefringence-like C-terminal domain-containing protein n=1 Tax=Fraxinus pennsylvanica TaxID=56036 RepID=A0AAD2EAF6_9LAMI|nr:unnamed protein product [Fraxinus pennsylvanica]